MSYRAALCYTEYFKSQNCIICTRTPRITMNSRPEFKRCLLKKFCRKKNVSSNWRHSLLTVRTISTSLWSAGLFENPCWMNWSGYTLYESTGNVTRALTAEAVALDVDLPPLLARLLSPLAVVCVRDVVGAAYLNAGSKAAWILQIWASVEGVIMAWKTL